MSNLARTFVIYNELWQILCKNPHVIIHLVTIPERREYDNLAQILLRMIPRRNDRVTILKSLIKTEVIGVTDYTTILRSNSLTSKILSLYMKELGIGYLRTALQEPLLEIIHSKHLSFEFDINLIPDYERRETILKQNVDKLEHYCTTILENLFNPKNMSLIPFEVREICSYMRSLAENDEVPSIPKDEPAESRHQIGLSLVGGVFFLRFVCPAIFAAESSSVLPLYKMVSKSARKNLIVITKVLQGLANGVEFGEKEEKMIVCNPLIRNHQNDMQKFLETISGVNIVDMIQETIGTTLIQDKTRELSSQDSNTVSTPNWRYFAKFHSFILSHDCRMDSSEKEWNGIITILKQSPVLATGHFSRHDDELSLFVKQLHHSFTTFKSPLPAFHSFEHLLNFTYSPAVIQKPTAPKLLDRTFFTKSPVAVPDNPPPPTEFELTLAPHPLAGCSPLSPEYAKATSDALNTLVETRFIDQTDGTNFLVQTDSDTKGDAVLIFFPGRLFSEVYLKNFNGIVISTLKVLFGLPSLHYTLFVDCGSLPQQIINSLQSSSIMTADNEYHSLYETYVTTLLWVLWIITSWFKEKADDERRKEEKMLREALTPINPLIASQSKQNKTSLLVAPEPPKAQTDQTLASRPSPLHSSNRQSDDGWDLVGTGREMPTQAILSRMKEIDQTNKKQAENKRSGHESLVNRSSRVEGHARPPSLLEDSELPQRDLARDSTGTTSTDFSSVSRTSSKTSRHSSSFSASPRMSQNLRGLDLMSTRRPSDDWDVIDAVPNMRNERMGHRSMQKVEISGSVRLSQHFSTQALHVLLPLQKLTVVVPTLKQLIFYNHTPDIPASLMFLSSLIPSFFNSELQLKYLHTPQQLRHILTRGAFAQITTNDNRVQKKSNVSTSAHPKLLSHSTIVYKVSKETARHTYKSRYLLVTTKAILLLKGDIVTKRLPYSCMKKIVKEPEVGNGGEMQKFTNSIQIHMTHVVSNKRREMKDELYTRLFVFKTAEMMNAFLSDLSDVSVDGQLTPCKELTVEALKEDITHSHYSTHLIKIPSATNKGKKHEEEELFVTQHSLLFLRHGQIKRDIPFLAVEDITIGERSRGQTLSDKKTPVAPAPTMQTTIKMKQHNRFNRLEFFLGKLTSLNEIQAQSEVEMQCRREVSEICFAIRRFYHTLFHSYQNFFLFWPPAFTPPSVVNDRLEHHPFLSHLARSGHGHISGDVHAVCVEKFQILFPLSSAPFLAQNLIFEEGKMGSRSGLREPPWLFPTLGKPPIPVLIGQTNEEFKSKLKKRTRSNSISFSPFPFSTQNKTQNSAPKPELPPNHSLHLDTHLPRIELETIASAQRNLKPPPSRISRRFNAVPVPFFAQQMKMMNETNDDTKTSDDSLMSQSESSSFTLDFDAARTFSPSEHAFSQNSPDHSIPSQHSLCGSSPASNSSSFSSQLKPSPFASPKNESINSISLSVASGAGSPLSSPHARLEVPSFCPRKIQVDGKQKGVGSGVNQGAFGKGVGKGRETSAAAPQ
ncbi:putative neurofibromatosis type 1 [Blattamonas nauphoetae]|uniref:Neurofibromatosis type 1 n=1 Tax=Blattamonas nauphoetae TaxID=2049346 RepID=A0ABQ9XYE4_9EUKA|nr:putative neurofibromatosis type 1 [Blattamonas nauphoetae]